MRPSTRKIYNFTRRRIRFVLSLIVTVITYQLTNLLPQPIRILLAFDLGVSLFLALLLVLMAFASAEDTYEICQKQEPSKVFTVFLAIIFSSMGLVSVALLLDAPKKWTSFLTNLHLGLALLAITLCWLLVHTFFALYYAWLYYDEITPSKEINSHGGELLPYSKGLEFPNEGLVDFWDFMYYSFTIAMCYQTSDVSINGITMRRVTLFHAILSFFYVSAVIGLVVNIVSNLV